jgi:DNA-binding NarL/FixJ family response regulator
MEKITVLMVDSHRMVSNAIAQLLNENARIIVVGEARNVDEAIAILIRKKPKIVLIEVGLDPELGFIKKIREISPGSEIIGLTSFSIVAFAKKLMAAGGMGYLTKNSTMKEVESAILDVSQGRKFVCQEIKDMLMVQALDEQKASCVITSRELEVITHIKRGLSSREIAAVMCVSTKTVEVHRYNIFQKLKVKNVAELVNYANMKGW